VESGLWPLIEVENRKLKITYEPKMIPVEQALKAQGRYKHLTKAQISKIQEIVNKEWEMLRQGKIFEAIDY
jgi:pyruvate ferredoxin oxidoreductase beta subunit